VFYVDGTPRRKYIAFASYAMENAMKPPNLVIIGASAAGLAAAQEVRKQAPDASITLISEEAYLPYHRPSLTELIGDDSVEQRPTFFLQKESWFLEQNITLLRGVRATKIDCAAQTVTLASGALVPFDRLLLAVGSTPFVPIAGALNWERVFAVRTLDDARRVARCAAQCRETVIIGGGLLGLEAANALLKRGHRVQVIELADRMLPMQLDPEGSRFFQRIVEKAGVVVHLSAQTDRLLGEGTARGIVLKSGQEIAADMVLFSVGVRANTDLAREAGIAVNRGIIVNARMESSVPGIYAAGDCAEFGRLPQLWMPAVKEGTVAGRNAAGGTAEFVPESYPAVLKVFGTQIYSAGDVGRDPQATYEVMRDYSEEEAFYRALFFRDGNLTGAILIGDITLAGSLTKAVAIGIERAAAEAMIR